MKLVSVALLSVLMLSVDSAEAEPTNFRWAIPPIFISVGNFQEGVAAAAIANASDTRDYKYGYIDRTGKFVIQPQFDFAYPFSDGVALVGYCGPLTEKRALGTNWRCKYGYINKHGKFLINPQFDYADSFFRGWARVQNRDGDDSWGKLFFINKNGDISETTPYVAEIKPKWAKASTALIYETSLSWFLYGLHPRESKEPLRHFRLEMDSDSKTKYGYVDLRGNVVVRPQFKVGWEFSEGLASVEIEHAGYGYINRSGELVIPPRFLFAGNFNDGLAGVTVEVGKGKTAHAIINREGEFVVPPNENWDIVDTCCEKLIKIKLLNEKVYGFISVN